MVSYKQGMHIVLKESLSALSLVVKDKGLKIIFEKPKSYNNHTCNCW